jgi:hypothetical protein
MRCRGDACDYVDVSWNAEKTAYVVRNRSSRRVVVQLGIWPTEQVVTLGAYASEIVEIVSFDDPYLATFLD